MNKKILAIGIIGMFLLTGLTAWGEHTISIEESDDSPPYVKITKPQKGLYCLNEKNESVSWTFVTIIIGWIDIEVDATDDDGRIKWVRFYIDGQFKAVEYLEPYVWTWIGPSFGGHTLKVTACDNAGNENSDEMKVYKFF